jgi:hypothetical protein
MSCKELARLFRTPIIQAPRRNSNLHKEMWTNCALADGFWACAMLPLLSIGLRLQLRASLPTRCDKIAWWEKLKLLIAQR